MTTTRMIIKMDSKQDKQINSFPLFDLSPEIIQENVCPNFSLKECGLFAQASRAAEKAVAFLRLLTSAVDAEPESYRQDDEAKLAAIAILKRHPELLFRKGLVTDHYGRKIAASPYQIFCGTFDVWALRSVHEEILPMIEDGEALAQRHFRAQFPNCPWPLVPSMSEEVLYDDRNQKQLAELITQLQKIDAKITADPCTNGLATLEATKKTIAELAQLFKSMKGEVIRTGLHFPLAIQTEIYKLYNPRLKACNRHQQNAWSRDQLAFFSREVIGLMESALTSVDGQCVKMGFYVLDISKGPDRRDGLFGEYSSGIPAALMPLKGKLGRTVVVDPRDGYSGFLTSEAGFYDWYHKYGRQVGWFHFSVIQVLCVSPRFCAIYGEQKQALMADILQTHKEKPAQHYDDQSAKCAIL